MDSFMKNPYIDSSGNKFWKNEHGQFHRDEDGLPACEYISGSKYWWKNGHRYRENGLPATEWFHGSKAWYDENEIMIRFDLWYYFI